jgi:hypothetical protein
MRDRDTSRKDRRDMEPSRFDELTKALATSTSRRQALKTIAATTLAGLLGLSGIGTAFAKCKPNGHTCSKDKHCCSGHCYKGTCVVCANPASDACNVQPNCGPSNSCFCLQSIEGGVYCTSLSRCATCASDSDCEPGEICTAAPCCSSGTSCTFATCSF